jgi:ABC-2 type transport system permease protein
MRSIVLGHGFAGSSLLIGAALAVVYVWGAWVIFTRTHRRAVRTGLIARYSAESVN